MAHLQGKPSDGPVSHYLNRPLSIRISRRLVSYPITPNQISVFSFLCSALASGLLALGGYPALLLGGILAQFASVIDGCDGEVARIKFQSSDYGKWLDAVLDRYADAFLLFGLTWHAYADRTESVVFFYRILSDHWVFFIELHGRQVRQPHERPNSTVEGTSPGPGCSCLFDISRSGVPFTFLDADAYCRRNEF